MVSHLSIPVDEWENKAAYNIGPRQRGKISVSLIEVLPYFSKNKYPNESPQEHRTCYKLYD